MDWIDDHPPALALLGSRLPDGNGQFHRVKSLNDATKNVVVDFHRGEERLVLKVYRHRLSYRTRVLCNPFPRHVGRSYRLCSTVGKRIRSEMDCIDGFRGAGLATFDVVERVGRDAILFRHCEGTDLLDLLREGDMPGPRRAEYVRRVAQELAQRQEMALRTGDRRLAHPDPRLTHVRVRADDTLVHFDFEGRTNPSLPLQELLICELETFLCNVIRSSQTRDPMFLKAAIEGVGAAALERRRVFRRPFMDQFSRNARRRRNLLARHLPDR